VNIDDLTTQPAVFSACRAYRYSLRRDICGTGPPVLFILLNPSTADETGNDPTIRRCMGFATRWGTSVLYIANLFALRATDPKVMRRHPAPVSEDDGITNDLAIAILMQHVRHDRGQTVCAWGAHGSFSGRSRDWRAMCLRLASMRKIPTHHLGLTKHGEPRHPLYLRADTPLELWV
jgi:hypothetical protein